MRISVVRAWINVVMEIGRRVEREREGKGKFAVALVLKCPASRILSQAFSVQDSAPSVQRPGFCPKCPASRVSSHHGAEGIYECGQEEDHELLGHTVHRQW